MKLNEKLMLIQQELKAPKNQKNNFGGYRYRSCEDILEAVKPLLKKYKVTLTVADTLEYIGQRYYIRALAELTDTEGEGESKLVTAYAREEESKKGMDLAQITGTASSYARKYALNGLFCIDDTKDLDTDEYTKTARQEQKAESRAEQKAEPKAEQKAEPKATKKQIDILNKLVKDIPAMLSYYKVSKIEDLTMKQASDTISKIGGKKE